MQVAPDVLLPAVTCRAEFVPYFLNLLRDCTAAVWSSRSLSAFTPLKGRTPVQRRNQSTHHSFRSTDVTPGYVADQRSLSSSSMCTPDSILQPEIRHNSTQRLSSAKSRAHGLSAASPSFSSPQELNSAERQSHATKPDSARHRPQRHQNTVMLAEYLAPSAKERQGHRALFSDASSLSGSCNVRKSAGKQKSSHGNKFERLEKTPVPLFNLDSNVDFPDMKSSQRYYFRFTCWHNKCYCCWLATVFAYVVVIVLTSSSVGSHVVEDTINI